MEILIKNGIIIDGTGKQRYKADIFIKGDLITKIGKDLSSNNAKTIDANGKIVCPGFIDMHNHADLTIMDANKAEAFVGQGMTTILVGVCGIGIAPVNEKLKDYYLNFVSKGFCSSSYTFKNLKDLFETLEAKEISINIAFLIPQGNVRGCVLGTSIRKPNEMEMEKMKQIVRENMEMGAFGLSTGLVYPPGSSSTTEELIELAKVVSKYGGIYDSHMRNEGAGVVDIGMKELIRIAREANIRAHISHWSVISRYKAEELTKKAIELMKRAREEGLDITADSTVYPDGFTSLSLVLLPTWVFNDFKKNLSEPSIRNKIKKEIFKKLYDMFISDAPLFMRIIPKSIIKKKIIPALSKSVTVIYSAKRHHVEGKPLNEVLSALYPNKNIEDALLDYILEEEGGIMIRLFSKDEDNTMIPLFRQEMVSPSSDAILIIGGNTHPRTYGAFPRVIARWLREKKIVTLEEMIRRLTSLPASILNLSDRGVISEGNKADIVIFDFNTINEQGTLVDGCKPPIGIDYVIVNGQITVEKGRHTGALNGEILRNKLK